MNVTPRWHPACHPDRWHYGKGLCAECWRRERRKNGKTAELERQRYRRQPEKYRAKNRAKYARDPQKHRDRTRRYFERHPERKKANRRRAGLAVYGITPEQYDALLAAQA